MDDKLPEPFWKVSDPRGLLGQTRAVALMRSDKRASYKHFALIEFHWGWAHKDYDWTSLASVRRMHAELVARDPLGGTPMSLPHINGGNRDLCEWGWLFEIEKGVGRTASRFMPNFVLFDLADKGHFSEFLSGDLFFSVNPLGIRKGFEISVHPMGNARVTYGVNTNTFSVHPLGNKDLLTGTVLKDGPTESRNDCAPALPPPTVGLEATAADGAQDGFKELWKAYGHRQRLSEAKAAYEKLAPDADLHDRMVLAARAWFESWAAQGKVDAPRVTLVKWIEREEYECDPPTAYKAKERKAKPPAKKTKPKAENDNIEDGRKMICDVGPFSPFGQFSATITGSQVIEIDQHTESVVLDLTWSDRGYGPDAQHTFYFQHPDPAVQERGQTFVRTLADILDIDNLTDTEQLHGGRVTCTINDRLAISYGRAA